MTLVVLSAQIGILASFGCEGCDWLRKGKNRPCWIWVASDWWRTGMTSYRNGETGNDVMNGVPK